jgi:hypothetical protein
LCSRGEYCLVNKEALKEGEERETGLEPAASSLGS